MDEAGEARMTYKVEHDWGGLIKIVAPDGSLVATLEKHSSGTPGSGIPVDTHAKLQSERAEVMAAALNAPAQRVALEETEGAVDPWVIMDKLRLQHSQEIHNVWMPLVAELREAAAGTSSPEVDASEDGFRPQQSVSKEGLQGLSAEEVRPAPSTGESVVDQAVKYTHDELATFAIEHFQSKCGRVIRVSEYGDPSGYYGGLRLSSTAFVAYELALVLPTDEIDLAVDDFDADGHPTIRGTWSIEMLTGPLKGAQCFAHGPVFHADGSVTSDNLMLPVGAQVGEIRHPLLTHEDLADLAWEDAKRLSESEVYVGACMGYVGDTNDQEHITLDPPALVVMHPYTRSTFSKEIQIRDYEPGNDVLDWDIDFVSDDPRLAGYRTTYCGAPSYYQDGRRDSNDLREAYDPTLEGDVEPTMSTMR